jgi:hypothetical protein
MRPMLLAAILTATAGPAFPQVSRPASGPNTGDSAAPPHLTGSVSIDMPRGTIAGRTCIARFPATQSFILNAGLNVKRITVHDSMRRYAIRDDNLATPTVGEGLVYTLRTALTPADTLCVEYLGTFPVYDIQRGDFAFADYKGFIAFNGQTLRAAEQAKWYPIPYDSTLGAQAHEAMTYQLTVRCDACRMLYLNGAVPQPGPSATFVATRPVALLLFVGEYTWRSAGSLLLINAHLSPKSSRTLGAGVDSIAAFYGAMLGMPFGDRMTFIRHAIIENNPQRRWGFVTYPTVAFSGDGLSGLVSEDSESLAPFAWAYLGHEMGHYYYGTVARPRGVLTSATESFAEFLALRTVRRFQGDSAWRAPLGGYAESWKRDSSSKALDQITVARDLHDLYRYQYLPLMLSALEGIVGTRAMDRFLGATIQGGGRVWDYEQLKAFARQAGIADAQWATFHEQCVRASDRTACVALATQRRN